MVVATEVDTEVWVAMEVVMEVLEMDMECKTDAARRSLLTAMRIQRWIWNARQMLREEV